MNVLDLLLNCVCLLLWLNWRSRGLTTLPRVPGIALVGTLRSAERRRSDRWPSSLVLIAVLILRAIIYRQFGGARPWTPTIPLGPITLHFRSDLFMPMLVYSLVSFAVFLAGLYFTLVLVAAVTRNNSGQNSWTAFARAQLGFLGRLPAPLLLLVPFVVSFGAWLAVGWVFSVLRLVAPLRDLEQLLRQAAVIALSPWLIWQYVVAAVLTLHIIATYVYLGNASFWHFIDATARGLLWPISRVPLKFGRIDLAPILVLSLMVVSIRYSPGAITWLYERFAS